VALVWRLSQVGIFMGLLFYSLPQDGTGVRSRLNLLFVMLAFVILMPYISMGLYTADKRFYLADASSKLYRPLAYYMAKVSGAHGVGPARVLALRAGGAGRHCGTVCCRHTAPCLMQVPCCTQS
jgi:hypothetical protein